MDKPRRPGRKAGPNAWDRYHTDMAVWKSEQQASRRQWTPGNNGTVSGQPAEVHYGNTGRDDRVDAYWPSGHSDYGHLVSNDGLNADYLREPGIGPDEHVVDNRQENPYGW